LFISSKFKLPSSEGVLLNDKEGRFSALILSRKADELVGISLHPKEHLIASEISHLGRREAFIGGRLVARRLLRELGIPETSPIDRGSGDEPIFPAGVVGSISHTGDLVAAAISSQFSGIGIDIEIYKPTLSPALYKRLCSPEEIFTLSEDPELRAVEILKIFSAKEAFYKAVYPGIRRYLGFRDVELKWDKDRTNFTGKIIQPRNETEQREVHGNSERISDCLVSLAWIVI